MHAALLLVAMAGSACSTMPDTRYPPHEEFDVLVFHELDPTAAPGVVQGVRAPQSTTDWTIRHLVTEPAVVERFDAEGTRRLVPTEPTPTLAVRVKGRLYGTVDDGVVTFPKLESLFPDAQRIERAPVRQAP